MYQKKNNIKQILYLSLFAILIILGLVFVFAVFVNNKQTEIFRKTEEAQLSRSVDLYIGLKESDLKNTLLDYTFWDEMVDYIAGGDKEWARLNLDPALSTFHFHAIRAYNLDKKNVYTRYDQEFEDILGFPLPDDVFSLLHQNRYVHSYIYTGKVLIELLGSTVHPSEDPERITPPRGYLFYAKVWDQEFMKEFSEVTATRILVSDQEKKVHPSFKNIAISKPLFAAGNQSAVAYLHVSKVFEGLELFNRFSRFFFLLLVVASLLIIAVLLFTSGKYVNTPLTIIENSLKHNSTERLPELTKYTSEFSEIGGLVLRFIKQKEELKIAKEKAEESDRLKSAFLANMSHEIRSPLNGIIGFSELLIEMESDEKTSRFARYISNRSQDLLRIINDILDFSRIEAQQLEVISQKFRLYPLIDELEENYKVIGLKNEAAIPVIFKRNGDLEINTDIFRLKQIFINLIDNALKFTEQGSVEVGYNKNGNCVQFYVKDTGCGIPDDKISIIFDRFRQISDSPSSRQSGNGLGLAICKGLLDLMHGKIWVVSEEQKGSTFFFTIPLDVDD